MSSGLQKCAREVMNEVDEMFERKLEVVEVCDMVNPHRGRVRVTIFTFAP